MQFTLSVLILAGVTAGIVPLLASVPVAAIAFFNPGILPVNIPLVFVNNVTYQLFDITLFVYLCYLVSLSTNLHKLISNSIKLKFQNDVLLSKLEYAAMHDPLTALSNRNEFRINIASAITKAKQKNSVFALLYFDIDRFKTVNDLCGHDVGDELLIETIQRIKNEVRKETDIARMGGDEFTIILEEVADPDVIVQIAKRICAAIEKPFSIKKNTLSVSLSMGISVYPIDGKDIDTLLKSADEAMYYMKGLGGNNFHFATEISKLKPLLFNYL